MCARRREEYKRKPRIRAVMFALCPFPAHESMWFARIRRVHERHQHRAEFLEIDRLGEVAIEASVDTLLVDVAEDVGRKRDDRLVRLFGALLPPAELFAGLVSIFVRHVKIAL
jgi:hypothetical protein